ncbi:radical SAM protein [Methanosarcina sp. Mfa9]|uniref:radical SAM protein n=1 Tax=Methanosarcina sp. Mfa9 TaxID=3439063 RepID=UPI003F82DA9F
MTLSSFGIDLLKIKAELLCYGVHPNYEATLFNPFFNESGYVHGIPINLEDRTIVNVPVNEKFVKENSPFHLKPDDENDRFLLYKFGDPVAVCRPVKVASNVPEDIKPILQNLRPHSETTLFYSTTKRCVYSKEDNKCRFCTYQFSNYNFNAELTEKALEFFVKSGNYTDIGVSGPTLNQNDCGIELYTKIIESVRNVSTLSTSVELVPPKCKQFLDDLYYVGCNSIIMNLEIFNKEKRCYICPGKSSIKLEDYIECWKYSVELFGENNVSSVLLVGLEDIEDTLRGIDLMTEIGVIPTVIPFKPYDNCLLNTMAPTSPENYLAISQKAADLLKERGLFPDLQRGCTACGGCSMEKDILNEMEETMHGIY